MIIFFFRDFKSIDERPLKFQPDSLDEVEHPGVVSRQRRDTEAYDYYAEVDEDEPLYTLYRLVLYVSLCHSKNCGVTKNMPF